MPVMILHLILLPLHICLRILDLLIKFRLHLLLGQTLGLTLMLIIFQLITDLILKKLDIVIKLRSFNSISVMA